MNQLALQNEDTLWNELISDPKKFGFPTFDEYVANREKFLGDSEEALSTADRGSTVLNRTVKRHIYEIEGYRCKSLEEVERIAKSQGIDIRALDYRPQLVQAGAGKFDVIVRFVSKSERMKREAWA